MFAESLKKLTGVGKNQGLHDKIFFFGNLHLMETFNQMNNVRKEFFSITLCGLLIVQNVIRGKYKLVEDWICG